MTDINGKSGVTDNKKCAKWHADLETTIIVVCATSMLSLLRRYDVHLIVCSYSLIPYFTILSSIMPFGINRISVLVMVLSIRCRI